ncbi:pyruvoyl-dependent arginine decarboxylase [Halorientalis litorea]|uniref:pyruvoyl-dependent arginine decarboxylase n=1 Tax=Halorientalis litorea TaxID=2931977 RepID=UPI001FF4EF6A|nr:pyruvoyl-dependent arginine decarboxylase [Halorientalis litorea]
MTTIRVVWGTATGPTPTASYDAALAEANVHNFNLVTVSSVIPADADLDVAGTAPELGDVGDALTVVQGRATTLPGESGAAGIGWARSASGRGIFYEADGPDEATVRERVEQGLAAGRDLRDWTFTDEESVVVESEADPDAYATAVVVAAYGRGRHIGR